MWILPVDVLWLGLLTFRCQFFLKKTITGPCCKDRGLPLPNGQVPLCCGARCPLGPTGLAPLRSARPAPRGGTPPPGSRTALPAARFFLLASRQHCGLFVYCSMVWATARRTGCCKQAQPGQSGKRTTNWGGSACIREFSASIKNEKL